MTYGPVVQLRPFELPAIAVLRRAAALTPGPHRRFVAPARRLYFTLTMSGRTLPGMTGIVV